MSFYDDSHILSRLGILQSKDECPRKILQSNPKAEVKKSPANERFVEVNIDGEVGSRSDTDEEPVFDRNFLLSPNRSAKVYRRKSESYKCIYLILLLIYFVIGAVWSIPLITQRATAKSHSNFLSINTFGILLGTITGKVFCRQLNIAFVSSSCTLLLCSFSWIITDFTDVIDARISIFLLGFASGNILYGGLATWFLHWRGYNRKVILFYVLMALGSSIALATNNQSLFSPDGSNIVTSSIALHKREAIGSVSYNDTSVSTILNNDPLTAKSNKSLGATGIEMVGTRSDQNEQMRRASTTEFTGPITAKTNSGILGVSSTNVHTATSRSAVTTSKATLVETTTTRSRSSSQASTLFPESQSILELPTYSRFTSISSTIALTFYMIAFISCCIPCSTRSDAKFLKLFDPSVSGLTRGCRIRLTTVQIIASLIEGLVELAAMLLSVNRQTPSILIMHHVIITVFRSVVLMCGPCAYSLSGCCLALVGSLSGCILVLMVPINQLFGYTLMSASTGVFALLVLLYLEVRVCPRAGTQLDYFIFPTVMGRFLSALLCVAFKPSTSEQLTTVILLLSIPLVMAFVLLVKSIGKAARLKEIMEYTSSPMLQTSGEYVSLVERDELDSDEEDDGSFANRSARVR
nr:Hypothetical protein CBG18472 [Haemonchus contortus]